MKKTRGREIIDELILAAKQTKILNTPNSLALPLFLPNYLSNDLCRLGRGCQWRLHNSCEKALFTFGESAGKRSTVAVTPTN